MKRKISLVLSIVLILSTLLSTSVLAANPTVYSQRDSRWTSHPYGKGDMGNATIGTSGCMLLSLTNAVYYLNGNFINPTILADFAIEKKCRKNYNGTADCFVEHAAEKFGNKYGFKYVGNVTSESKLKAALRKGQVAVWHTSGHIMSVVEYDSNSNKYLVLNSEIKTKTKKAHTWLTYKSLSSYGTTGLCFMLLENTESKQTTTENTKKNENTTTKWPATKNIKTYVVSTKNNTTVYKTATSNSKYGTIYATDLITINGYNGSRLKVTYPVSGGTKTGYIDKSAVTSSKINVATTKKTASSKITAYRRSSGNTELGYISKGDVYYEIATQNGRTQVIYPISGGYKMGWIKK